MSLTIIEGCDGSGKTTLIQSWKAWIEDPNNDMWADEVFVSHHDAYLGQTDIEPHYMRDLERARMNSSQAVIMDRSWISEFIYGPAMRDGVRLDVPARRRLERMTLAAAGICVYCTPPYEVCERSYLNRKHLEYLPDESKLRRVYDGFAHIATNDSFPAVPSVHFDWTQSNNKNLVNHFISTVESIRWTNKGPGTGNMRRGNTLIVCDGPTPNFGFPAMESKPLIDELARRFEAAGVGEDRLYWIDARTPDLLPTAGGAWLSMLRPRKVLTLGDVAHTWALSHDLPHAFRLTEVSDVTNHI